MTKKKLLLYLRNAILLCVLLIGLLLVSACGGSGKPNNEGLYFGKYYLNGSEDSYLEILNEDTIIFVNVDFTCIDPESYWGDTVPWKFNPVDFDVDEEMQGENFYVYIPKRQALSVEVVEGRSYALAFKYNGINQIKLDLVDFDYIFTLEQE